MGDDFRKTFDNLMLLETKLNIDDIARDLTSIGVNPVLTMITLSLTVHKYLIPL